MARWTWAWVVVAAAVGCEETERAAPPARAELRSLGGTAVEFIPKEGQHPYCLLYTVSEQGVIRQLTMTRENRSIKCEAGKRIYNSSFRIPVNEGKVKAYIFFSDQRIQAGSVAQQLNDLREKPKLTAMDFRLPGSVALETLEFTPRQDSEPVMGSVVGTEGSGEVADEAPAEGGMEGARAPEGASEVPVAKDGAEAASETSP